MTVENEQQIGTVFISYSHDSPDHAKAILNLSNRLRSEGVDCVLDQYVDSPPEGWPHWMDREIRSAQFVLMICTPTYFNRVMGSEEVGVGLGVKWEGNIIYQHLYNSGSMNNKFIPIIVYTDHHKYVPTPIQGATIYNLENYLDYEKLYSRLIGRSFVEKPELGKRRPLPKKEVKTNVAMYLSVPIDVELWNRAKWSATFFMFNPNSPPILGLAYKDKDAARSIFKEWHERYGDNDEDEELRISIIEGNMREKEPGYTVHIGPDPINIINRYKKHGFDVDESLMLCVSRHNRMVSQMPSRNLELFKQLYRSHKTYLLAPGVVDNDGKNLQPMLDLFIRKGKIVFKDVNDIGPNDVDVVVLPKKSG